jgi:hypothetical protein
METKTNKKSKGISSIDFLRVLILVAVVEIAATSFFLTVHSWKGLGFLVKISNAEQLQIIGHLLFNYLSVSAVVICLIATTKRGFKNIESLKEKKKIILWIIGMVICGSMGASASVLIGVAVGLLLGTLGLMTFGLEGAVLLIAVAIASILGLTPESGLELAPLALGAVIGLIGAFPIAWDYVMDKDENSCEDSY